MMLFKKKSAHELREHLTKYWDERLYSALFSSKEVNDNIRRYFACTITRRESKFNPQDSSTVEHKYYGNMRVSLSQDEYSDILIEICSSKPHDYYTTPMNDVELGYASFGWKIDSDTRMSESRKKPCLHISAKDIDGFSESVSKLFIETKAAGGAGLNLVWAMNIEKITEQSAQAVWGNWDGDFENESEIFPGRKAFPLVTLEFSAYV